MGRKTRRRGGCCTHRRRGQQSIIYPGAKKQRDERASSRRVNKNRKMISSHLYHPSWIFLPLFAFSNSKFKSFLHFFLLFHEKTRIRYRRGAPREQSLMAFPQRMSQMSCMQREIHREKSKKLRRSSESIHGLMIFSLHSYELN
jgi:hypothetical protein